MARKLDEKRGDNRIPKYARWAVEMIEELGAEVYRVDKSKHYKLRCRTGDQRFMIVAPMSPSDHRARLNFRSRARQIIHEHKGTD